MGFKRNILFQWHRKSAGIWNQKPCFKQLFEQNIESQAFPGSILRFHVCLILSSTFHREYTKVLCCASWRYMENPSHNLQEDRDISAQATELVDLDWENFCAKLRENQTNPQGDKSCYYYYFTSPVPTLSLDLMKKAEEDVPTWRQQLTHPDHEVSPFLFTKNKEAICCWIIHSSKGTWNPASAHVDMDRKQGQHDESSLWCCP